MLGNGNGTFGSAKTTSAFFQAGEIAVADLNQDGSADLALTNYQGYVQVLLGDGEGTFRAQKSFATAAGGELVLADFNGDGHLDLILSSEIEPDGYCGTGENPSVYVELGYGDGTFNPAGKYYDAGNYGFALALGDFNGDGKTGLAVLNDLSSTVAVLQGTSSGISTDPVKYAVTNESPATPRRRCKWGRKDRPARIQRRDRAGSAQPWDEQFSGAVSPGSRFLRASTPVIGSGL
jgi:hypothetical protein